MENILVDTCVWIDYFRNSASSIIDEINNLLDTDRVTTCGIVESELICGIRDKERESIQDFFDAIHYVECERKDFLLAGELLNKLRKKSITIPITYCIIASQCMRRNLTLFTLDKDFDHIQNLNKFKVWH